MLFHMEKYGNRIEGWLSPDNPGAVPRIRILRPDSTVAELEANVIRPDVRDQGLHPTGHNGFAINDTVFPDLAGMIDQIEIRDADTGVLLYRPFKEEKHVPLKVLRFEPQAMPYAQIESIWDSHFSLYYNAAERYPFETMFGVLNNPATKSISISGRLNYGQYEHYFRDRDYKIISLLRHPLEEMAERLLFIRYALAPQSPVSFDAHLTGLRCLGPVAQRITLDRMESIDECLARLSAEQKTALSNPMIKALACKPGEVPRKRHVQVALSKLAAMDLVGVRTRYDQFKHMMAELIGRDILANSVQPEISWARRVSEQLRKLKSAQSLVSLDMQLYELVERAVGRVVGEKNPGRAA